MSPEVITAYEIGFDNAFQWMARILRRTLPDSQAQGEQMETLFLSELERDKLPSLGELIQAINWNGKERRAYDLGAADAKTIAIPLLREVVKTTKLHEMYIRFVNLLSVAPPPGLETHLQELAMA